MSACYVTYPVPAPSPYTRQTYRYTPLLAVLLTPNEWIHLSFGKYLFAGCDIIAGVLMHKLLVSTILPLTTRISTKSPPGCEADKPVNEDPAKSIERQATMLTAVHLLNPLVFSISTRGSSESVLSLFVLSSLYCALRSRWNFAAMLLGLSTHWKIYPFIYGVACLGVIGGERGVGKGWKGYVASIVNRRTIQFGFIASMTFGMLGVAMYIM